MFYILLFLLWTHKTIWMLTTIQTPTKVTKQSMILIICAELVAFPRHIKIIRKLPDHFKVWRDDDI